MSSAEEFLQRMEKLQAAKGEAFKPLAEILGQRAAIQAERDAALAEFEERLAALNEPYGKAYAAAEKAGWTPVELAELGVEEPVKRPRGRRPGRSTAPKKTTPRTEAAPETRAPETVSPAVPAPAQESAGDAVAAAGFPSS
ncbi:hypothetical protein ACFXC8_13215 [Streptomyces sp. NPDC059441]|uniref:hypothetical protein n=1 Tax=Streptomyces sp. NPDC059441 TaxID=3346829 RepID=UPI00369C2B02